MTESATSVVPRHSMLAALRLGANRRYIALLVPAGGYWGQQLVVRALVFPTVAGEPAIYVFGPLC